MSFSLSSIIITIIPLALGITVHETAHALVAWMLGDSTARSRGRISLNPLNHIDPFGTILLPLLMLAAGGPVFAFAKPVPVYLGNLSHPRRDEVLVALAGPVSNIILACISAMLLKSIDAISLVSFSALAFQLLFVSIQINLSLAFFNLIPLPPLDGSAVLVLFLKGSALDAYYRLQAYAMPILIGVLYLLPELIGFSPLSIYFSYTLYPTLDLLLRFALGS